MSIEAAVVGIVDRVDLADAQSEELARRGAITGALITEDSERVELEAGRLETKGSTDFLPLVSNLQPLFV
jgi:hypothetical protein